MNYNLIHWITLVSYLLQVVTASPTYCRDPILKSPNAECQVSINQILSFESKCHSLEYIESFKDLPSHEILPNVNVQNADIVLVCKSIENCFGNWKSENPTNHRDPYEIGFSLCSESDSDTARLINKKKTVTNLICVSFDPRVLEHI
ncbi:hypothetical protein HK096_008101 [Nowakowskiella sp. JEL0078]|nr:hypothetical protein HK096_008101 [Nowakowskiella sp. JEL0078]